MLRREANRMEGESLHMDKMIENERVVGMLAVAREFHQVFL